MSKHETKEQVSFRDRIPLITDKGKRKWIYAQKPHGKFYNIRSWVSLFYLLVFFSLPLIKINGFPAVQINIPEARFYFFGMVFWPQDFFIFGLMMVAFVVFIVLFTMIYGRVFCGWACPQTIFMEMVFRRIETWIEGSPAHQRQMNHGPWTTDRIIRKTAKHIVFFLLSFLIANTFLAYIIGADELFTIISEPVSAHIGGFLAIIGFTFVFYFVYAFIREIVCTIICPYGRLQGVLLDRNSVVVAYDYHRGEPREKGKRPADHEGVGDCIDCNQCVAVCPTGIDIRNGTQLECTNCTACIDACNSVMSKIHLPKGLIRFASENEIADRKKFRFTPRMKVYSTILAALTGVILILLFTRKEVQFTLVRTTGQMFQEQGKDSLSNLYNVTLTNKTHTNINAELKVENVPANVKVVGLSGIKIPSEQKIKATVFIYLSKKDIRSRETDLHMGLYQNGKKIASEKATFIGYTE